MKKILFVTANGVGLGHIRRSSLIVKSIQEEDSEINILFATMCKKVKFLDDLDIPYLKLRCLSDEILDDQKKFKKAKLYNIEKYKEIIMSFRPNLIVLDIHVILNSTYYDFIFDDKYRAIKKVFIFRINDSNNFKETVYENKKLEHFTKLILPHSEEELEYILGKQEMSYIKKFEKFEITGPIIGEGKEGLSLRRKYDVKKDDFLITFSVGGGGAFKKAGCESALSRIEDYLKNYISVDTIIPNLRTIIILGPLFDKGLLKKYFAVLKKYKIHLVEFEKEIINLFKESDLLITTTGYNTANEVLYNNIPAILMPIKRGDDQFLRAKYLEKKGIVKIYDKEKSNITNIIKSAYEDLDTMKDAFNNITVEIGNNKAAKILLNII